MERAAVSENLFQVRTDYGVTAGVVKKNGKAVRAAPIIRRYCFERDGGGKSIEAITEKLRRLGYSVTRIR